MLGANKAPDLQALDYPILVGHKLDGIRCLIKDGQLLSRALKPIRNQKLWDKLAPLRDLSIAEGVILDGELFSADMTFQEITSVVMSSDKDVPEDLQFWGFDIVDVTKPFSARLSQLECLGQDFFPVVEFYYAYTPEKILKAFDDAIDDGYEGLILRAPDMPYKYGRSTLKEQGLLKVKPYETFDARVLGVVPRYINTNVSLTNELGNAYKRRTLDAQTPTDIAAAFVVEMDGHKFKVTIPGSEDFRRYIYHNKDDYIGTWIEFKGMNVGAKESPRHPVFERFREDRG